LVATGAFLVALGTLRTLGQQLGEMQRQTKATLQQMRIDQRPWVLATIGDFTFLQGVPTFPVKVSNTGKTPARQYRADIVVKRIKNARDPSIDFVYDGVAHLRESMGVMLPNAQPLEIQATEVRMAADGKTVEPRGMSDDEALNLIGYGADFVVIYGVIAYQDVFGVDHWTKFCTFASPSHKGVYAQKCTAYNDVDKNDSAGQ